MLTVLTGGLTFLYVAYRTLLGSISVGSLTLYVQAADGVSQAFSAVLGGLQSMYEHQLYLTTLFELLDFQPLVRAPETRSPCASRCRKGSSSATSRTPTRARTSQRSTTSASPSQRGETVAIVGHNGAGKTTLVKLVARLYDPQAGQVLIDGRDVREYDPDELRGEFGVLFQDYVSYQFSARENIGIGRVERLDDSPPLPRRPRRAAPRPVIEGLPEGYETVLGKWFDGGVNLSGGEWQKVALGRAFMREAQILILDEPSAALDAKAEYELFSRLQRAGPRPHRDLHLAPLLDRPPRRSHPGLRTGPPDRVGHARRADGARRAATRSCSISRPPPIAEAVERRAAASRSAALGSDRAIGWPRRLRPTGVPRCRRGIHASATMRGRRTRTAARAAATRWSSTPTARASSRTASSLDAFHARAVRLARVAVAKVHPRGASRAQYRERASVGRGGRRHHVPERGVRYAIRPVAGHERRALPGHARGALVAPRQRRRQDCAESVCLHVRVRRQRDRSAALRAS